ncbi:MAG: M15 family metallopeptidase [Polyangiaceae bacterium]
MKTLRIGSTGPDVVKWQHFLRGLELYHEPVDGQFDDDVRQATIAFQRRHSLNDDGIIGNRTLGEAMRLGFSALDEDRDGADALDGPPKPAFEPLDAGARKVTFGDYPFEPAPTPDNPEGIRITSRWERENIELVTIPQLVGVRGATSGRARFHRLVVPRVLSLFERWEQAGLQPLILSWGGSFVPRFIRGSRSSLSNHAYGSAFDINAEWNGLGAVPRLLNEKGSVRKLVPIANELGFYWGGHFNRRDGMHFELAKL